MQAHLIKSLNGYVVDNNSLRDICQEFVMLLSKAEKDIRRKGKRMAWSEMDCKLKKLGQLFHSYSAVNTEYGLVLLHTIFLGFLACFAKKQWYLTTCLIW